jgi:ABC-type phosphate/phosphonate transport system substrate-binding protein
MKEVEKALGRKIDFFVANDYRTVSEALDQGLALSAVSKRSKVFKSIMKLSDDLAKTGTASAARREPRLARELRA